MGIPGSILMRDEQTAAGGDIRLDVIATPL
jgi:hypothetical protein